MIAEGSDRSLLLAAAGSRTQQEPRAGSRQQHIRRHNHGMGRHPSQSESASKSRRCSRRLEVTIELLW